MNSSKLAFLGSVRFWKVAIVAVLLSLQMNGYLDEGGVSAFVQAIEILLGTSVAIRTIDRQSEVVAASKGSMVE